ncbi:MAG TPA: 3-oxoacyl-[acyl-carrier-protein] reductase [Candidatus Blautia stercoripullorum]|uniref:3-oxoacyl-[acyl-carrier-protein] reductase n=1 Tax=Candidatus Blautia stercoripullorum TaxID=2838502 RepID=A0A9D2R8S6_9FIRM|nr:3-oxoacyl-[acyl-carrier-protein] reductase [Candidatus Blautia stercoripullorum]
MLDKKVALVTGASRGIGREIALTLAAQGNFVVVNYNGSEARAKEVVETIEKNGGQAAAYQCSVSDFNACQEMIQNIIKEYGRLDILVNNAGITRDNLIMRMKEEDFDAVINTNLKGTFNTIRHTARQMLKQKSGKIINISSVSGILGNAGQANYAASKAGVIGLTKTMARELASRGITVNAVAPGFVDTEMTEVLSEEVKEAACKQIPLGRFGKTKDIAEMVAYLASDKADYITGQVISVDGGMCM